MLGQQGQYAAAVDEFTEAIRLEPDFAEPHYNLGSVLDRQGQYAAAVAMHQEAIRLKPVLALKKLITPPAP